MNTPPEATVYRSLALTNTGVAVTAAATRVFGWSLTNSSGAIRYVKLYNKATAATSSDTPVFTIGIPTLATVVFYPSGGVNFPLGLSARCVTEAADNGTTGATSGDVLAHVLYKSP
jgi:hypothetical protein